MHNIENILTEKALKLYETLKESIAGNNIQKKEFRKTYIAYAGELKKSGFKNEAKYIIVICGEYLLLAEKPIVKKQYYMELFDRLDYLICIKRNSPDIYRNEYVKFRRHYIEESGRLAKELYTPEDPLDEETCYNLLSPISKYL